MTVSRINNQMFSPAGAAGARPVSGLADQFLAALTEAGTRTSLDANSQTALNGRGRQTLTDMPATDHDLSVRADDVADDSVDEAQSEDDQYDPADDYWDVADGEPPTDGETVTVDAAQPHQDDDTDEVGLDDDGGAATDQDGLLGLDAQVAMVDAPMQPVADDQPMTPLSTEIDGADMVAAGGVPAGQASAGAVDPALAGADADADTDPAVAPQMAADVTVDADDAADTLTGATPRQAAQAAALTAATGGAAAQVQVDASAAMPANTSPATASSVVTAQAVAAEGDQDGAFQQPADQGGEDGAPSGQDPSDGQSRVRLQTQARAETTAQTQAQTQQAASAQATGSDDAQMVQQAQAAQSQPKTFAATLMAAQSEATGGKTEVGAVGGNTAAGSATPVVGLGAGGTAQAATAALGTTASAPTARTANPAMAQEVMDQVKVQIAKHGTGGDTIKVQLRPVELGAIEVKLSVGKDGSVSGVVTADNQDTLNLLKNDSRSLEKALSDAGLKTDQGSLEFSLRGDGNQNQTTQNDGGWRRSRRSRSFDSGALDALQGVDGVAAQSPTYGNALSGVDIQV